MIKKTLTCMIFVVLAFATHKIMQFLQVGGFNDFALSFVSAFMLTLVLNAAMTVEDKNA